MKKILSLILIIAILFGIVPIVYADASSNVTLTVDKSTVNVGDTVTVTLKTSQKVQAVDFSINYSKDLFEYLSSSAFPRVEEDDEKNADSFMKQNHGTNVQVAAYSTIGYEEFILKFKAKAKGNAIFSTDIDSLNLDTNGNTLPFENKSVNVTVQEAPTTVEVTSISLNKTTVSLEVGKTTTLTAIVEPSDATDKTVIWTSNDESIATVSNGMITGVKEGTTTITAKAGTKTATCTVTVTKNDEEKIVEVASISLNKTTASVEVGKTTTLIATVEPSDATDKTVIWTSSDEGIATVSNGIVTGVKEGTATITAKAGTKTANCTITVTKNNEDKMVEVTSISLDKNIASIKVGDTLKLTATILPENATNKTITWTSSDASIATVTNGTIKALKEGTTIITASAENKTATCKITVINNTNNSTNNSNNNKDNTIATKPIPQTGETYVIFGGIIAIISIAIISIIKYRRYKDI